VTDPGGSLGPGSFHKSNFGVKAYSVLKGPARLSAPARFIITGLTKGAAMTRQAITKHLRVMEVAGLVRNIRQGRESFRELDARGLDAAQRNLALISKQWDQALERLRRYVEE